MRNIQERKDISKTKTKQSQDQSRDTPKKSKSQNVALNESLVEKPIKTVKKFADFEKELIDIDNIWVQGSNDYPVPNIIIPVFWIQIRMSSVARKIKPLLFMTTPLS